MDKQTYSNSQLLKTAIDFTKETMELCKGETVDALLPATTSFAIVVELIERQLNESFWEVSTSAAPLGLGGSVAVSADDSLRGRFVGYLAIGGGAVQLYKDGTLYAQNPLPQTTVDLDNGSYVLHFAAAKYKFEHNYPIAGTHAFQSAASGFNGGLNQLFAALQAGGAQVEQPSAKSNITILIIFAILFFGGIAAILLLGHH